MLLPAHAARHGQPGQALLLSGVIFAVAHLPNPSLTLVTFFAGVGFTGFTPAREISTSSRSSTPCWA